MFSVVTSRRRLLGAGAALTAGLASRAAGAQDATPASTPVTTLPAALPSGGVQADGSWAFTDDLGVTVTAAQAPTRVVSHVGMAAALYDFGFEVIGYYNPATDAAGAPLPIAGDLPLERLTPVGDYDNVDVELLLALDAELFIGQNYSVAAGDMWPFSAELLDQIKQVVPVLSFAYGDGVTVVRNIESIENLAAALGADVTASAITADRGAFAAASDELRRVLAEKPNMTTLFMSGSDTGFWVDSAGGASTRYYKSLGMEIIPAPVTGEVSWEAFLTFEADLIFVDDRVPTWWSPEQLAESIPVWGHHPAVQAGQVAPWRAQFISSYRGFTPVLEDVVAWVQQADETVV